MLFTVRCLIAKVLVTKGFHFDQSTNMKLNVSSVNPSSLTRHEQDCLRYMAIAAYPYETCGLIHKHNIIVELPNTFAGDHKLGYDMEFNLHDPTIKAIWHSHPNGLEVPSRDDIPCIQLLAERGFNFHHVIVTPKAVFEYEAKLIDSSAA